MVKYIPIPLRRLTWFEIQSLVPRVFASLVTSLVIWGGGLARTFYTVGQVLCFGHFVSHYPYSWTGANRMAISLPQFRSPLQTSMTAMANLCPGLASSLAALLIADVESEKTVYRFSKVFRAR